MLKKNINIGKILSKYKLPNNIKEILLKYNFSWKINFETKE